MAHRTARFELLHTAEAAELLGLKSSMLERLRWMGEGPPYVRPTNSRAIRYRHEDILAWIDRHRIDPEANR